MIIGALAISIGVLGLLEGILYGSTGFNISIFLVSIISGVSFCGFAEIIQLLEDINWKLDKKDE